MATKQALALSGYHSPSESARLASCARAITATSAIACVVRKLERRLKAQVCQTNGPMSSADVARAFWIVAPGRGEIRPEPIGPASADHVVVRAMYSGVSRGTEALVFEGRVPASEYQRMRAPFQAGEFPAPVKYGYASVGQVEQGPRGLADRNVFVL